MLLLVALAIVAFFGGRFLGARYGADRRYGDYTGGIAVLLCLSAFLTYGIAFPGGGAAPAAIRVATVTPAAAAVCPQNPKSPNRATLNRDGSLSNVDGVSSSQAYPLPVGTTITIQAQIAKGATTGNGGAAINVGNRMNGYEFQLGPSDNLGIVKWIGGAPTSLGSLAGPRDNTDFHLYRLTITVLSSSDVQIQGTRDGLDPNDGRIITDSSLKLSTCTWPITIYTGGSTGKLRDLTVTITHRNSKSSKTLRPNFLPSSQPTRSTPSGSSASHPNRRLRPPLSSTRPSATR